MADGITERQGKEIISLLEKILDKLDDIQTNTNELGDIGTHLSGIAQDVSSIEGK